MRQVSTNLKETEGNLSCQQPKVGLCDIISWSPIVLHRHIKHYRHSLLSFPSIFLLEKLTEVITVCSGREQPCYLLIYKGLLRKLYHFFMFSEI